MRLVGLLIVIDTILVASFDYIYSRYGDGGYGDCLT